MSIIRFDENVSKRVVVALRALGQEVEFDLEHPHERDEAGQDDVDWLAQFAARGGRCVVSGDERMRDRPPERAALQAAGVIAVFPPEGRFWNALGLMGQAAYLIRWFPVIIELAGEAPAGTHFRLPMQFTTVNRAAVLTLPMID